MKLFNSKNRSLKAFALATAVAASGLSSQALAGDAAAGKAKAAACAACHGANGISSAPTFPNLAGQKEAYLVAAMKAYKKKQRTGGTAAIMQAQMASMSETDMKNLAAYYSGL